MNYFDKILYLYPNIQHVMYWHTQPDGSEWDDPYDGLQWYNKEIEKPTKKLLESLNPAVVAVELAKRNKERNPVELLEDTVKALTSKIENLADNISKSNSDLLIKHNENMASIDNDNMSAIKAIQGFLQMIPDMNNQLANIQELIKEKKS